MFADSLRYFGETKRDGAINFKFKSCRALISQLILTCVVHTENLLTADAIAQSIDPLQ